MRAETLDRPGAAMVSTVHPLGAGAWFRSRAPEPGKLLAAHTRRRPNDAAVAISVAALVLLVGGFLAYMVLNVPVLAPRLPRSAAVRHWGIAAVAAAAVILVDAGVIVLALRRSRTSSSPAPARNEVATVVGRPEGDQRPAMSRRRAPRPLALATLAASAALFGAALAAGSRLWVLGLAALTPWLPLASLKVLSTAKHEPVYAFFAAVVGFQLLHMGEHSVQVAQLALTGGDLARSHGVFGQLDFELIHFVSDIAVWLALGAVIICLRGTKSPWLWIAFGAASAHAVEHLYLWWIYLEFRGFYTIGGFAGIMGSHGVIGSPLGRPYMHFGYNFVVVVPMVLALLSQARRSRSPGAHAVALTS